MRKLRHNRRLVVNSRKKKFLEDWARKDQRKRHARQYMLPSERVVYLYWLNYYMENGYWPAPHEARAHFESLPMGGGVTKGYIERLLIGLAKKGFMGYAKGARYWYARFDTPLPPDTWDDNFSK